MYLTLVGMSEPSLHRVSTDYLIYLWVCPCIPFTGVLYHWICGDASLPLGTPLMLLQKHARI